MTPRPDREPAAPVVQRIRIRYAKRGRLRFLSHRDFARALERAVRRAQIPIAYSSGFSPHPRISYVGAAPTGVASEAEYAELALQARMEPEELRTALDHVLPPGLDVIEAVEAQTASLADRIQVSHWRVELSGVEPERLRQAVDAFLAASEVPVERLTKQGRRSLDARAPVVRATVVGKSDIMSDMTGAAASDVAPSGESDTTCAILELVVRHVTPSVRPDEVLAGLRVVADLEPPVPPRVARIAQGALTEQGAIIDPLQADRDGALTGTPSA